MLALLDDIRRDGVTVRSSRPPGQRTGRIAVMVALSGERSFVADRGAADGLAPADLRAISDARPCRYGEQARWPHGGGE